MPEAEALSTLEHYILAGGNSAISVAEEHQTFCMAFVRLLPKYIGCEAR